MSRLDELVSNARAAYATALQLSDEMHAATATLDSIGTRCDAAWAEFRQAEAAVISHIKETASEARS